MKSPVRVMLLIIIGILVIAGGGVAVAMYMKHQHHTGTAKAHALSAKEAAALQVTLPQMTTNLESSGLIQFTLTLQADNKSTKKELSLMQYQIQDDVNEIMRQYTPNQLRNDKGLNNLKQVIQKDINGMLDTGNVTNVYFSQVLVQ
ncbi:flagellar basal body-associated FliL family protein [Alicyclobacillus acidoterrestris]|uniref:flagellar basal body-associated FliL family protein n=1 Tax=Alicyclobacillus acidoterrestris TaxID=1450 RepID=UPI003F53061D